MRVRIGRRRGGLLTRNNYYTHISHYYNHFRPSNFPDLINTIFELLSLYGRSAPLDVTHQ